MADGAELPDEAEFIDTYSGQGLTVEVNGRTATFDWFVAAEAAMCPADEDRRQDPALRLHKLAAALGADSLIPEHQALLEMTFED